VIYWDTSCVLKLYAAESDSARWRAVAKASAEEFASSALLDLELAYALEQKEVRGELKAGAASHLLGLFREHCRSGQFILYPVGTDVMKVAAELAVRCYRAKEPVSIRTLDGLHLATAMLLKCHAMATADRRMTAAAALLKMPVLGNGV
jgi:predicted nucleic acid-binding protein